MKKLLPGFIVCILFYVNVTAQHATNAVLPRKTIHIKFYKNIEFTGFVFFLGYLGEQYENNESLTHTGIKKKDFHAYNLSLYRKYKSFKSNSHLAAAVQIMANTEGSDMIRLLMQLTDFPHAALPDQISATYLAALSEKKDSVEGRKNALLFIESLNRFYIDVNFDAYFQQAGSLYNQALLEIKSKLPAAGFIDKMEKFYRHQFDEYTIIPSLTIPAGMAFACSYTTNNKTHISNVFGPFAVQQFADTLKLNMGFADETYLRELSTHEFGHSFTNPVLNNIPQQLMDASAGLFDTVKTAMANQGYNNWKSCIIEHFVRAGEVMIARNLGNYKDADRLQKDYIENRKFIYLPVIITELERYNKNAKLSYWDAVIRAMEKLKMHRVH